MILYGRINGLEWIITSYIHMGGLGIPNLMKYYEAAQLSRITQWSNQEKNETLYQLEQLNIKTPLESLLWSTKIEMDQLKQNLIPVQIINSRINMYKRVGPRSISVGIPMFSVGHLLSNFVNWTENAVHKF